MKKLVAPRVTKRGTGGGRPASYELNGPAIRRVPAAVPSDVKRLRVSTSPAKNRRRGPTAESDLTV